MKKTEVEKKVIEFIYEQVSSTPIENIKLNASLKDDISLDSLDIYEIAMKVEKEYDITIADDVLGKWYYVNDIVNTVLDLAE